MILQVRFDVDAYVSLSWADLISADHMAFYFPISGEPATSDDAVGMLMVGVCPYVSDEGD